MNARCPVTGRGGRRSPGAVVFLAVLSFVIFQTVPSAAGTALDEIKPLLTLLTGELQGIFTAVEGRPLAWRLVLSSEGTVRKGEMAVTGADCVLRIALEFEPATDRLRWQVIEGRMDLAAWVPALGTRPELASMLTGLSATGIVTITGEGTWSGDVATGGLRAELNDGTLRNDTQGWSFEGVTLRAGGDAAELLKGRVPVELVVRTISTSRFGARALTVNARLSDFERVEVESARVEIAGGEVTAEPFTVSLAAPAVGATLVMTRVGLQDLVVFVPTALSEAHGRINGKLRLDWDPKEGVQVGAGGLSLEKSEPTTVRLVSSPGFLTGQVPARFTLLPSWLGPLARWFSPVNPGYKTLSDIERGKISLQVEALDVRLTPEGDERGRSASVSIRARPEQAGGAVGEVTFQINVSGPLAAVLRLGMKQSFSLQMH